MWFLKHHAEVANLMHLGHPKPHHVELLTPTLFIQSYDFIVRSIPSKDKMDLGD